MIFEFFVIITLFMGMRTLIDNIIFNVLYNLSITFKIKLLKYLKYTKYISNII